MYVDGGVEFRLFRAAKSEGGREMQDGRGLLYSSHSLGVANHSSKRHVSNISCRSTKCMRRGVRVSGNDMTPSSGEGDWA